LKTSMTNMVVRRPIKYDNNPQWKYVLLSLEILKSNLNSKAMKIPGRTISPRPNIAQFALLYNPVSRKAFGNTILMGALKFFATVTITFVPKTQNMS